MGKQRTLWLTVTVVVLTASGCCAVPKYTPTFWNDAGTIQFGNNCYNYGNNKRTDTYAQPGRAAGIINSTMQCDPVRSGAIADGLDAVSASGKCPCRIGSTYSKLALVVAPGWDYHWYRLGTNGMWSHKMGPTAATNVDNSSNPIGNPETADRGAYTDFCGYLCSCSSATEGQGHENIQ